MDIGELLTRWYEAEVWYNKALDNGSHALYERQDRDTARTELVEAIKNATR